MKTVNDGQHAQAEVSIRRLCPGSVDGRVPPNPESLWSCDLGVEKGQDPHLISLIQRLQPQGPRAWGSGQGSHSWSVSFQLLHFAPGPCSPNKTMLGLENGTSTLRSVGSLAPVPLVPLPPSIIWAHSLIHTQPQSLARVLGAIALTANSRVPARQQPPEWGKGAAGRRPSWT